jgi:hypothetical protein
MAAAITDFLHRASLLYLRVSQGEDTTDSSPVAVVDEPELVLEFQDLVGRLASITDGVVSADLDASLHDLAKACWKVSQDILLRLRRPGKVAGHAGAKAGAPNVPSEADWNAPDVEALGLRLSDLKSQWKVLQPSHM